jgi:transposase-like protein
MSKVEAARIFGVSRQAIHNWMNQYEEGGHWALKTQRRGRPVGPRRLKALPAAQVVRSIAERCPDLIANVRGYLRSTPRQPQIVRNYFQKPEVLYAAS